MSGWKLSFITSLSGKHHIFLVQMRVLIFKTPTVGSTGQYKWGVLPQATNTHHSTHSRTTHTLLPPHKCTQHTFSHAPPHTHSHHHHPYTHAQQSCFRNLGGEGNKIARWDWKYLTHTWKVQSKDMLHCLKAQCLRCTTVYGSPGELIKNTVGALPQILNRVLREEPEVCVFNNLPFGRGRFPSKTCLTWVR